MQDQTLALPDSFWPLWLMIGGRKYSLLHHEIEVIILNQSYLYWCLIHLMQAKKVALQTAMDVT